MKHNYTTNTSYDDRAERMNQVEQMTIGMKRSRALSLSEKATWRGIMRYNQRYDRKFYCSLSWAIFNIYRKDWSLVF